MVPVLQEWQILEAETSERSQADIHQGKSENFFTSVVQFTNAVQENVSQMLTCLQKIFS